METRQPLYDSIKLCLTCGLLLTITFSKLNLNSLCIILLATVWLFEGRFKQKWVLLKSSPLFVAFTLFTLLHFFSIAWSPDLSAGWKNAETKTGLLILPLIFCSSPLTGKQFNTVMLFFCGSVTAASMYCMAYAMRLYQEFQNPTVFFYHELVAPIKHHAIYFSVYLFVCIVFAFFYIFRNSLRVGMKVAIALWILFMLMMIILLSSKMVLSVLLLFILGWWFYRMTTVKKSSYLFLFIAVTGLLVTLLVTTDNPVRRRFANLMEGNMNVLYQEKFHPADYFNGAQFRLLLWRVTYLVLNEERAWVKGVSPSAAQPLLQDKYRDLNLYTGDQKTNNGYLDYNCHNQFLQTTLQLGLIGLASLILVVLALARFAINLKDPALAAILILTFFFCFTESLLERQYGIILVGLIPCLFLRINYNARDSKTS